MFKLLIESDNPSHGEIVECNDRNNTKSWLHARRNRRNRRNDRNDRNNKGHQPCHVEIVEIAEFGEMTEWYLISFLIFQFLNVSIFPTLHGISRNRRSHRNNRITIILLSHPLGAGKNKLEVKCRNCGSILANVLTNDYKDLFGLFPKGELLKELYRGVPLVECLSFPRLFDFKIYHPCKTHDKKNFYCAVVVVGHIDLSISFFNVRYFFTFFKCL